MPPHTTTPEASTTTEEPEERNTLVVMGSLDEPDRLSVEALNLKGLPCSRTIPDLDLPIGLAQGCMLL